ncbi:putative oxidoreductase DltE 1 [Colletotrichum chlorophyti]|uniref:Putative oxidoreductase DltE 1 n=1 Tax=Colletotrichum chlorophyti TaxID=708187 RepID=A0A1Q8S6E8_9PEZI|nr:putative oxidoreductase DltE 1 [Colletotrichum chlorophyti]
MLFSYKTVLITSATSGIGHALAARFIQNNIFVIAAGRRKDRLGQKKHWTKRNLTLEIFHLKRLKRTCPTLSAIFLNAGVQRVIDFTKSSSSSQETLKQTNDEVTTNYLSPLHTTLLLLPHLRSLALAGTPTAVVLVSSGLGLVPMPIYPNYCASKAAVHSLAWQLRTQLQEEKARQKEADASAGAVRGIEIVPPTVQTDLTAGQGMPNFGSPLEDFIEETWTALDNGDSDEILVGPAKQSFGHVDDSKKGVYDGLVGFLRTE